MVTDLKLPALGGLELLKTVRETYPQVPVVVLGMGAADYIPKPFLPVEFLRKLERVVHSYRLLHDVPLQLRNPSKRRIITRQLAALWMANPIETGKWNAE